MKKIVSIIAAFSLLLNSFYVPVVAIAQELSPTPEPTPIAESTETPVVTTEPSIQPTEVPISEPTPIETPIETITPIPTETPTEVATVTPEPSVSPTPEPAAEEPQINEQNSVGSENTDSSIPSPSSTPEVKNETSKNVELKAVILENTDSETVEEYDFSSSEYSSATLITDKADYAPTDTVLITGSGFTPNKEYGIEITSDTENFKFSDKVTSDESGGLFYAYQLDGTYRPNYKVEVKDGSVIVSSVTFTDSASPALTWPTTWNTPNSCVFDPGGEPGVSPTEVDLIGDSSTPAVGFASDANYYYFRERVNGNPGTAGSLNNYSWVVLFQTSSPQYQYLAAISGKNPDSQNKVVLYDNLVNSPVSTGVDFDPLFNDPADTIVWSGPSSDYGRVTGTGPYYIDWAIPILELTSRGINTSTTKFFATSTNANNYNKDHLQCYDQFADLSIIKSDSPDPVTNGGTLTYTLAIHNAGPDTASSVIVTDTLPTDYTVTSVTPSTGSCSDISGPDIQCELGDMISGANATITIVGTINTALASVTNTASVSLDTTKSIDLNLANNTDSEDTSINPNTGKLTIVKETIGGNATFDFTSSTLSSSSFSITTSGNTGSQIFSSLLAGNYDVSETVPSGWDLTSAVCSDGSSVDAINLSANEDLVCTFTNTQRGSIEGYKFESQFGEPDTGLTGILGWTIELYGCTTGLFTTCSPLTSTTTASDGSYSFLNLVPGYYQVKEILQNGWTNITSFFRNVTVDPGEIDQSNDFVNFKNVSVTVCKLEDPDGDLSSEEGRTVIPDWSVSLIKNGDTTNQNTKTTSANGCAQWLDIGPGSYAVTEEVQTGWTNLTPLTHDFGTVQSGSENSFNFINTHLGTMIVKKVMVGGTDSFDFTGDVQGTISTNNGTLTVNNVVPGDYTSVESAKTGWDLTDISCNDGSSQSPSDPNVPTGQLIFKVDPGETVTCTFTNTKLGSISGMKFNDLDRDRVKDTAEPGLAGWTINLDKGADGTVDSTTITNADGNYEFTGLTAGTYRVREQGQSGWTQSSFNPSDKIIQTGTDFINVNFGNYISGAIKITKDVVPDDSSTWTFTITGTGVEYIVSGLGDNQSQTVSGIPLGSYNIVETTNSVYSTSVVCGGVQGPAGNAFLGTVVAGQTLECTFTNTKLGKITAHKFVDKNINGILDGTDSNYTFGDIAMELYPGSNCQGTRQSIANTNGSGDVLFQNLTPGDYSVKEVMTATDWKNSTPRCQNISIDAGEEKQLSFGNYPLGTIYGFKYNDTNANGVADTSESTLSGWTINLVGPNGYSESRVSNASGYVEFANLDYGTYTYSEVMQSGWMETIPLGGRVYSFTVDYDHRLPAGSSGFKITNVQTGSITIIKNTVGGDGTFNFEEDAWINPSNPFFSITTVNGTGNIQFSGLKPHRYQLFESVPAGWDLTNINCVDPDGQTSVGSNNPRLVSIDLDPGENITCTFTNTKLGSIQGKKYEDMNGDGDRDPSDTFLSGWTINLYKQGEGWEFVESKVTGHTGTLGQYRFENLMQDRYLVCETLKDSWMQTAPISGTRYNESTCFEIDLSAGQNLQGYQFGNFEKGKVQGMKFEDVDGDSLAHETGEAYLNGWDIRLYKNWEEPVTVTTSNTGETGQYRYEDLLPGTYYACEVKQVDWAQTWPNVGDYPVTDGGILHSEYGVAVDNLSGAEDEYPVCWQTVIDSSGDYNQLLKFGNARLSSIHGFKWDDINGDGERCTSDLFTRGLINSEFGCEEKLSGWTIELYKITEGDGQDVRQLIDSMQTDSGEKHFGWYWFEDVLPGNYEVCEVNKSGWEQTYPFGPVCHEVSIPDTNPRLMMVSPNAIVEPTPEYNFGNFLKDPKVEITKSNNKNSAQRGDTVTYTLTLTNSGNMDLNNVKVIDALPGGFSYIAGTSMLDGVSISDPTISGNTLEWNIGSVEKDGIRIITYDAKILDSVINGSYKNLATCNAEIGRFDRVFDTLSFAVTQTDEVVETTECNIADSTVNVGLGLSFGGNLNGQVLGASIELPATGNPTWLLALALLGLTAGLYMKKGKNSKNKSRLSSFLVALLGLIVFAKPAMAITPTVSIQGLPGYVNTNDFKLSCSALGGSNVQFAFKKEGGSYQDFGGSIDITSNPCQVQVTSSQVSEQVRYYFKVTLDGGVSEETNTFYDISGPSPVSGYYKDTIDSDDYKIHWKNPSDTDLDKVIIYRGETVDFPADNTHEIARVSGSPSSDMTYDEHTPDPNKTYFYALRAIDKVGNSSSLVGDGSTTTTTTTVTQTQPQNGVGEVKSFPKEATGQVLGEEDGESLKVESTQAPTFTETVVKMTSSNKWIFVGGALILLAIGLYIYFKKKNR